MEDYECPYKTNEDGFQCEGRVRLFESGWSLNELDRIRCNNLKFNNTVSQCIFYQRFQKEKMVQTIGGVI
jgi:hypothetical protein